MKQRLMLAGIVLITAAASGCQSGPYAFFRDPDEQRAINQAYTQDVMARQGSSSTAVGATRGSGGGTGGTSGY